MADWIDARDEPPILFGKYFVKINNIKQVISFHEFDFYLNRGEEVLWLKEDNLVKPKSQKIVIAENIIVFDPLKHFSYHDHQKIVYELRGRIIEFKDSIKELKESNDSLKYKLEKSEQKVKYLQKEILASHVSERIPQIELKVNPFDAVIDISTKDILDKEKAEIKKILAEDFSQLYSRHLDLRNIKHLFPALSDYAAIPKYLLDEMLDIYTEAGVKIINSKLKLAVRYRKKGNSSLTNQNNSHEHIIEEELYGSAGSI